MSNLTKMNGKPFACKSLIDWLPGTPVPRNGELFGHHTELGKALKMLHRKAILPSSGYHDYVTKKLVRFSVVDMKGTELAVYDASDTKNIVLTKAGRLMLLKEGSSPADFVYTAVRDGELDAVDEKEEMLEVIKGLLHIADTYADVPESMAGMLEEETARAREVLKKHNAGTEYSTVEVETVSEGPGR